MTTEQKARAAEAQSRERTERRLTEAVLRALGRPADLWTVQARWLWADNYRVNVLTGGPSPLAAIAHSYFLRSDDAGEILEASPPIERRYEG